MQTLFQDGEARSLRTPDVLLAGPIRGRVGHREARSGFLPRRTPLCLGRGRTRRSSARGGASKPLPWTRIVSMPPLPKSKADRLDPAPFPRIGARVRAPLFASPFPGPGAVRGAAEATPRRVSFGKGRRGLAVASGRNPAKRIITPHGGAVLALRAQWRSVARQLATQCGGAGAHWRPDRRRECP